MAPSTYLVACRAILLLDRKPCCVPKMEIGMPVFLGVLKVNKLLATKVKTGLPHGKLAESRNSRRLKPESRNFVSLEILPVPCRIYI